MEKVQFYSIKLKEWGGEKWKVMVNKIKGCQKQLKQYISRRDVHGIQKYNEAR